MKRFALLSVLFVFYTLVACHAQNFTTEEATQIQNSAGQLLSAGTIYWTAVDNAGNQISYQAGGGGQVIKGPVACGIANGAIVPPCSVANTSLTNPQNICFAVTVKDALNQLVLGGPGSGYNCVQPQSDNLWCTAGVCNFDKYVPNINGVPLAKLGPPGPINLGGIYDDKCPLGKVPNGYLDTGKPNCIDVSTGGGISSGSSFPSSTPYGAYFSLNNVLYVCNTNPTCGTSVSDWTLTGPTTLSPPPDSTHLGSVTGAHCPAGTASTGTNTSTGNPDCATFSTGSGGIQAGDALPATANPDTYYSVRLTIPGLWWCNKTPSCTVPGDWTFVGPISGLPWTSVTGKPTTFPPSPHTHLTSDITNLASTLANYVLSSSLAAVALSGSYNDLSNRPTIPPAQVNSDWNASGGVAQILNKPTIPPAPVNADWNAISGLAQILNKPTITAPINADWTCVTGLCQILNKPTNFQSDWLTTVINRPTIPAAQIQSDWNQSNNTLLDFIKNKPTIPAAPVNADWNAVSGLAQILNKPTIPAAQIQSDWTQSNNTLADFIKNKPTIPAAQVNSDWNANSGLAQILNKPTIPAAQIQSDWTQSNNTLADFIKNKPTIPAAQVNSDWNANSGLAQILNKPTIPTVPVTGIQFNAVDQTPVAGKVNIPPAGSGLGLTKAITKVTGQHCDGQFNSDGSCELSSDSGGTPPGSDKQIVMNIGGAFGTDPTFYEDPVTHILYVQSIALPGPLVWIGTGSAQVCAQNGSGVDQGGFYVDATGVPSVCSSVSGHNGQVATKSDLPSLGFQDLSPATLVTLSSLIPTNNTSSNVTFSVNPTTGAMTANSTPKALAAGTLGSVKPPTTGDGLRCPPGQFKSGNGSDGTEECGTPSGTSSGWVLTGAPAFDVSAGDYNNDLTIHETCDSGATAYWTTDNTTSNAYSTSITVNSGVTPGTTLKGQCRDKTGYDNSTVTSRTYTLTVGTPSYSPDGGTFGSTQNVTVSTVTTGSPTLKYCLDTAGTCDPSTGTTVSGTVAVSSTQHLRSIGTKTNYNASQIRDRLYTISGSITSGRQVRTFNGTNNYLAMAGSLNNTASTIALNFWLNSAFSTTSAILETSHFSTTNGAFSIWQDSTNSVMHFDTHGNAGTSTNTIPLPSASVTHHYVVNLPVNAAAQVWVDGVSQSVTSSLITTNTNKYPSSTVHVMARNVSGSTISGYTAGDISGVAIWNQAVTSGNVTDLYACKDPSFVAPDSNYGSYYPFLGQSPESDVFHDGWVAANYATVNGATMTLANFSAHSCPAIPFPPTFSTLAPLLPFNNDFDTGLGTNKVSISCAGGLTPYYVTNGTVPGSGQTWLTIGSAYSTPITVNNSATLNAACYDGSANFSDMTSAPYNFSVATPTLSPSPGTFTGSVTVNFADITNSASFLYCVDTTNACNPTTSGTSVTLTTNASPRYVRVKGTRSGYSVSGTTNGGGTYTVN